MQIIRGLRADYNDLPPATRLTLVSDGINQLEAKKADELTANERDDLQALRDE